MFDPRHDSGSGALEGTPGHKPPPPGPGVDYIRCMSERVQPGHLYVVGTPIGNLDDLTARARRVLSEVDAIACEDTRRTRKLLSHLELPRPRTFFSCHEHNEERTSRRVLGLLQSGVAVALCSDAGMPLISDPGYIVLRDVRAAGHPVEIVPGPSAVLTALVASGMAVHSWTFKGFPPRRPGRRRRFLADEAESTHTLVIFESAPRLPSLLSVAHEVLGPREAAVCLELTKRFERVERGTLEELAARYSEQPPKGEVTLVIAGRPVERRTRKQRYPQPPIPDPEGPAPDPAAREP